MLQLGFLGTRKLAGSVFGLFSFHGTKNPKLYSPPNQMKATRQQLDTEILCDSNSNQRL